MGSDLVQPQGIFGPKVMIINERAGSGGDAMPWYFKRAGVGKLIGTRTWGGLVGMAGGPPLMDGGFVGAPSSGIYNPITGEWEVENIGVPPDIEVEQDPALVRKGRDPQSNGGGVLHLVRFLLVLLPRTCSMEMCGACCGRWPTEEPDQCGEPRRWPRQYPLIGSHQTANAIDAHMSTLVMRVEPRWPSVEDMERPRQRRGASNRGRLIADAVGGRGPTDASANRRRQYP